MPCAAKNGSSRSAARSASMERRPRCSIFSGEKVRNNKASSLGLEEKQFNLKNGNVINYVEGPKNGPAILLLHGQMVDWKDYRTVFPELVKNIMYSHLIIMDMENQVKILIYIILKA